MTQIAHRLLESPIGALLLEASERGLCRVAFDGRDAGLSKTPIPPGTRATEFGDPNSVVAVTSGFAETPTSTQSSRSRRRGRTMPTGSPRTAAAPVPPAFDGRDASPTGPERIVEFAASELRRYFESSSFVFSVPLDEAGTAFQRRIWLRMRAIAPGESMSYGELAVAAGAPGAARAVGLACARNPIPILTPCHRIIGSDGSLHGFAGGLWRKEWLLGHEGARLPALVAAGAEHAHSAAGRGACHTV